MTAIDWESLGVQLLERERRPVLLLDLEGRVARANRAFVFLLADGTVVQGVSFKDEWLHASSRLAFEEALARVKAGERPTVTVSLVNTIFPVDLVLELAAIGQHGGERPGVMAVMTDAVSRGSALPLKPVTGITYEVVVEGEQPRRVTRALASEVAPLPRVEGAAQRPCWAQIFGRQSECPSCPVRRLAEGKRSSVVVPADSGPFSAQVMLAERRGEGIAAVTSFKLDGELYSAIITARVAHLAEQAKLTQREQDLLALLLMGRSLEDVAIVSGITARTAKYHQQNLLKKLGADSRLDLFRLLL